VQDTVGKRIHHNGGRLSPSHLIHFCLVNADLRHHDSRVGHGDQCLALMDNLPLGNDAAAAAAPAAHHTKGIGTAAGPIDDQPGGLGPNRTVCDLAFQLVDPRLLRPETLLGVGQPGLGLSQPRAALSVGSLQPTSGFNIVAQPLFGVLGKIVAEKQVQIDPGVLLGELAIDDRQLISLQIQIADIIGVVELLRAGQPRLRGPEIPLRQHDVIIHPLQFLPGGRPVQQCRILSHLRKKRRDVPAQVCRVVGVSRKPFRQLSPQIFLEIHQGKPDP